MTEKVSQLEGELLELLKLVAPGTSLRQGLEIILQAGTGGLIVVGDSQKIFNLVDGGFKLDCFLTPMTLAELAKMDGAIILSRGAVRILGANAQLIPDYLIPSDERGTRHRTAERMAKQTGSLVIAISELRNIITLYKGQIKYVLRRPPELISRANQAIQILEKYRAAFDTVLNELEIQEFEDDVQLFNVVKVVQKGEQIKRVKDEIDRYIVELGEEARFIEMQLKEVVRNTLTDHQLVIKDYVKEKDENASAKLNALDSNALLEPTSITGVLGYGIKPEYLDLSVSPRGYRVLSKIPRFPAVVVENLIKAFDDLPSIIKANINDLITINEVGEKRANSIKRELERLRDRALLRKY